MENKQKILLSLKKAKGSIEHIEKMVESGGECFVVIQQTLATIGLLQRANEHMLEEHIERILKENLSHTSQEVKKTFQQEMIKIIRAYRK
jgi:DNA-binding FrmR family transcriptional regulator